MYGYVEEFECFIYYILEWHQKGNPENIQGKLYENFQCLRITEVSIIYSDTFDKETD